VEDKERSVSVSENRQKRPVLRDKRECPVVVVRNSIKRDYYLLRLYERLQYLGGEAIRKETILKT
jgi:hypothetical protein